jgi:hypothetical protein
MQRTRKRVDGCIALPFPFFTTLPPIHSLLCLTSLQRIHIVYLSFQNQNIALVKKVNFSNGFGKL